MWLGLKSSGAEPDKSYCIGESKKYPDLVLEIALTSGGMNKLELYRRFKVPEVWIWRNHKLEIYSLGKTGKYEHVAKSALLPDFDVSLLERCVPLTWRQARKTIREGISRKRGPN
jgi:Uma2 family endonuclease